MSGLWLRVANLRSDYHIENPPSECRLVVVWQFILLLTSIFFSPHHPLNPLNLYPHRRAPPSISSFTQAYHPHIQWQ